MRSWFRLAVSHLPNWVRIRLDTTPPVIRSARISGAAPGSRFEAILDLDEPGIISAELQAGELVYPLTVDADDSLRAFLPDDVAIGPAEVRVYVRDDVGNEAIRLIPLMIGVEVAQPPSGIFSPIGQRVRFALRGRIVPTQDFRPRSDPSSALIGLMAEDDALLLEH